jgi:MgtC family
MELSTLFQNLGISLGLGLLVGLQRESVATPLAGLRTFPLVTILGTVCALLGETFGGGVIATGLVALAAMIFAGKVAEIRKDNPDSGLTTEIAMLLMFAVGAYLVIGHRAAAISIGGGVAVLLHFKGQLHRIVARLGENDLKGIMQFTLISLVILPVLPNRAYGPLCGAQSAEHLVDGCSDRRHQPGWVYRLQVPGPASGYRAGRDSGRHDLQHCDDGKLCPEHEGSFGQRGACRHRDNDRLDRRLRAVIAGDCDRRAGLLVRRRASARLAAGYHGGALGRVVAGEPQRGT